MADDNYISVKELVEVRKMEMESMLPGLMTEIIHFGNATGKFVYSPDPYQKNRYRNKE